MPPSAFLKLAGGLGVIGVIDRAILLVTGMLVARWLGPSDYGAYAFVMATLALLLLPVQFGLGDWLMRELATGRADPLRRHAPGLIRRVIAQVIGQGIVLALIVSLALALSGASGPVINPLQVGLWLLPLMAAVNLVGYALRGLGQVLVAQLVTVLLRGVVVLLGLLWLIHVGPSHGSASEVLMLRLGVLAVVLAVAGLVLRRIPVAIGLTPVPSPKAFLKAGAPFLLLAGGAVILAQTDVLMLGALIEAEAAGMYNVAAQGGLLITVVLNLANAINAPEFARLHAAQDRAALQRYAVLSSRAVLAVALPAALILTVYADPLLRLFFGEAYRPAAPVLSVLAPGLALSLMFGAPGFLLNMSGHEQASLRILIWTVALNIGLNLWLIHWLGPVGAALATVIALTLQKGLSWWAVRSHLGIDCSFLNLGEPR